MKPPDKENLKAQWLVLIDRWGESYIRDRLNKGVKISQLRKQLQMAVLDDDA